MEGFDELDEIEKWSLAKRFYVLIHASVVFHFTFVSQRQASKGS